MKNKYRMCWLGLVLGSVFSLPAGAALVDEGNGLIRDTVLKIYWLQDASLGGSGSWSAAENWANNLVFAGRSDWRLPSLEVDLNGLSVNCRTVTEEACRDNEFGHLYYWDLTPDGDTPPTDPGTNLTGDTPPFESIQRYYWAYGPGGQAAWYFDFATGNQGRAPSGAQFAAWAVHPVPLPAALWLFAAGLLGLAGFVKRKR